MGAEEQCFNIHASVLTASGQFFKSVLKNEWAKMGNGTVHLRDLDSEIFNIYVQWLYSDRLAAKIKMVGSGVVKENAYDPLVKLYALGERLNDAKFQDTIISAIIRLSREVNDRNVSWYPSETAVNTIYENTTRKSPAKRLMVDFYVRYGYDDWFDSSYETNRPHHEFLFDLSRKLLQHRQLSRDKADEDYGDLVFDMACKYHNHGQDERCDMWMV